MGSVIVNEKTKEKCQIFTPIEIVDKMLDLLGYSHNLYGKSILESSCGNGQFLKEIVRRYINDCKMNGLSRTRIKNGLRRDIYGIELDPMLYQECIISLNEITDSFNIKRVSWQIKNADALRDPFQRSFDFIVGNPPYVSYWDLDSTERCYIEENYSACQFGAWDYSYAFLQDGFSRLNQGGRMAFIVPNSVFKTNAGIHIRNLLRPYVTAIYDYTTTNVFENVLTSPAILVVNKATPTEHICYHDLSRRENIIIESVALGDSWVFKKQTQTNNGIHRFGDYFQVSTSIATQCNKVFVLKGWTEENQFLYNGETRIEKAAVRKAASPRGKSSNAQEYIIFPYYYLEGKLNRYSEDDYKKLFPFSYEYLNHARTELEKRDADKNSKWFEYGRSQALAHINCEKLILSTVITGRVRAYKLDDNEVPYSGLFITIKDREDGLTLDTAEEILASGSFWNYIVPHGINARGKSIRIVAKNVLDYCW